MVSIDSSTGEGLREIYGGDIYASGALSARPEWLTANPDAARRLARALSRAHQWITAHKPEDLLDKLPAELHSVDRSLDIELLQWGMESYTAGETTPPLIEETIGENFARVAREHADREALVEVAREHGTTTIAERVEDANTMAVLWQLGIEFIQGFFGNSARTWRWQIRWAIQDALFAVIKWAANIKALPFGIP